MFTMAKRNIKLYFRDKASVIFSLFAVLVIIALNIFFLTDSLNKGMSDVPDIEVLVGTWLVAGIVAVTTTTTSLGALNTMVEDKSRKIYKDFYTSPLKRSSLAGGYIISCVVIGIIMSVIAFVAGMIYIVYLGGRCAWRRDDFEDSWNYYFIGAGKRIAYVLYYIITENLRSIFCFVNSYRYTDRFSYGYLHACRQSSRWNAVVGKAFPMHIFSIGIAHTVAG